MDVNPNPTATAITLIPAAESMIRDLYAKYQGAEGRAKASIAARREAGLALGKALCELRAQAEVVSGGTTFDRTLKSLEIPRRTAYRWVKKYELSVGIKVKPLAIPDPVHPRVAKRERGILVRVGSALRGLSSVLERDVNLYAAAQGCLLDDGHHESEDLPRMISAFEDAKRVIGAAITILKQVQQNTDASVEGITPEITETTITTAVQ
jgi:hypothetical protein